MGVLLRAVPAGLLVLAILAAVVGVVYGGFVFFHFLWRG